MVALILEQEENEEKTRQIKRRKWVHKAWKNRETEGEFATLYKELVDDATKFYQYFRIPESCFNILLSKLKIHLQKKDTLWRISINPRISCLFEIPLHWRFATNNIISLPFGSQYSI